MKRNFTFLTLWALLLALLPNVGWGETVIDLSSPKSGEGVIVKDNIITIKESGDYKITGSTTSYKLVMEQKTSDAVTNIILENASIILNANSMSDKPFSISDVDLSEKVNITLIGKNYLQSLEGEVKPTSGLTVPYGHSIDIDGNGILYASGNCGIGHGEYSCGDITISGGTVVAKGTSFSIGGVQKKESLSKFIMGQSAFVVAYDTNHDGRSFFNIECVGWTHEGDVPKVPGSGIYCNVREDGKNATLYGPDNEITLSSPFPDDEFVLDLNGKELTLGDGIGIKADQIINGTLNAYQIIYPSNLPEDVNINGGSLPKSNAYYGPNTDYTVEGVNEDLTANVKASTYQHIKTHWLDDSNNWIGIKETKTTSSKTPTGIEKINYGAVWVLKNASFQYLDNEGLQSPLNLYGPEGAQFTIEAVKGDGYSDLSSVGLEISGRQIKKMDNPGSLTAGEYKVKLKFTYNNSEHTEGEIRIKIIDTPDNVSSLIIEAPKVLTYKGAKYDSRAAIVVKNGDNEAVPLELFEIEFSKDKSNWSNIELKDAGQYYVKITAKSNTGYTGYQITDEAIVVINKANAKVSAKDVYWTIGVTDAPVFTDALTVTGVGSDKVSAAFAHPSGSWSKVGVYEVIYTSIKLDNDNYNDVNDVTGKLIVKKKGSIEPGDPDNPDTEIKIDGGWEWVGNGYTRKYDGIPHPLNVENMVYYSCNENNETLWKPIPAAALEITYEPTAEGGPKDVNKYTAKINIKETEGLPISGNVNDINLEIIKAVVSVHFRNLTEDEIGKTLKAVEWVDYYEDAAPNESPKIDGEIIVASTPNNDGKYSVKFTGLKLIENNENNIIFNPDNYIANWYYGDTKIEIGTDGNGSIDIDDPTDGDGDGGIIVDYNDLHIIKSTGATLTSRYNKMRVKDGGSFTLSLEKEEGYEDCEPTVYYKRGRFGEWKELKLDEVSGYYQIRSVYTDIYVKVSGDGIWPVSNEEVEAQEVKVYTQNGAIVVVTPSVMDVQVVSMTGSVVAADKVAGQREFRNLAEGVYIVRVGDKIVKIRL